MEVEYPQPTVSTAGFTLIVCHELVDHIAVNAVCSPCFTMIMTAEDKKDPISVRYHEFASDVIAFGGS